MSSLFHSLAVEGIIDELVIESLQKGTIQNQSIYMLRQVGKHYQSGDIAENSNNFLI
jgi:hypothetical protein